MMVDEAHYKYVNGEAVEITSEEVEEFRASLPPVLPAPPAPTFDQIKEQLKAQVDLDAMAARLKYTSPGMDGTYRQKLEEAKAALADPEPTEEKYPTLGATIGIEIDPLTGELATDVLGIARLATAIAEQWIPLNARIERVRLGTKKMLDETVSEDAARAVLGGIAWP